MMPGLFIDRREQEAVIIDTPQGRVRIIIERDNAKCRTRKHQGE